MLISGLKWPGFRRGDGHNNGGAGTQGRALAPAGQSWTTTL